MTAQRADARDHPPATLGEAWRAALSRLRGSASDTPELDARILVAHAAGCAPLSLVTAAQEPLSPAAAARLETLLAARLRNVPVARLTGTREFWSLDFALSPETLVPRPDSETLVAAVLAAIEAGPGRRAGLRIADLGTGSGCLLVALLSELPHARGIGTDLSAGALATALGNARRNGVHDRALFVRTSWAEALAGPLDVIVSNPPYIETAVIASLAAEVAEHEPRAALDGGADGLASYRALLPQSAVLLAPGGLIGLEIGAGQADAVADLVEQAGLAVTARAQDLGGKTRAILAHKPIPVVQKPLGLASRTG